MYRSSKRLYVNRDRSKLVPENSPEAAFVLVGAGGELEDAVARKYGLLGASEPESQPEPQSEPEPEPEPASAPEPTQETAESEPEAKAEESDEDKAMAPTSNKARAKSGGK